MNLLSPHLRRRNVIHCCEVVERCLDDLMKYLLYIMYDNLVQQCHIKQKREFGRPKIEGKEKSFSVFSNGPFRGILVFISQRPSSNSCEVHWSQCVFISISLIQKSLLIPNAYWSQTIVWPWLSWLCFPCCSSSPSDRAELYTPRPPYKAASDTTISVLL